MLYYIRHNGVHGKCNQRTHTYKQLLDNILIITKLDVYTSPLSLGLHKK